MVLNKAALGIVCVVDCGQSEYKTYLICTTSVEHRYNTARLSKNLTNCCYLCLDWYFGERSQHLSLALQLTPDTSVQLRELRRAHSTQHTAHSWNFFFQSNRCSVTELCRDNHIIE